MHPCRHTSFFQSIIVEKATVDIRFIVFCLNQHCGRSGRRNFHFRSQLKIFTIQIGRINQQAEIRTATCLVCGIHGRISAFIKVVACHRRKMSAGRKSHYSDTPRVQIHFFRMGPDISDRTLHVLQRSFMLLATFPTRDTVFYQHSCYSQIVQPFANFVSFQIVSQNIIPSTGTDYHCRPCSNFIWSRINSDCRFTYISNP